jgi:hypothetical protein
MARPPPLYKARTLPCAIAPPETPSAPPTPAAQSPNPTAHRAEYLPTVGSIMKYTRCRSTGVKPPPPLSPLSGAASPCGHVSRHSIPTVLAWPRGPVPLLRVVPPCRHTEPLRQPTSCLQRSPPS